jgi:hypothetical protein
MPEILSNSLKMSLLSGLFVFIALWGFTIYSLILCFILRNTLVISWFYPGTTNFFQKQSFISSNYTKASHKKLHAIESCLPFYEDLQKHTICTLHFKQYSKKHLKYALQVLKSKLNNHKCSQKPSKALDIYPHSQLYPIFQLRYRSFFNQNPTQ